MKPSRYQAATAALVLFTGLACSLAAHADMLYSRLGGLAVYDATTNLSWLANANAAVGSAYDTYVPGSGLMDWADANAWAASLNVDGVTGWSLPTTADTSCGGYNCTGSEMGNLFYNALGGTAGTSITTSHNANYNLFTNVQSDVYWSATEYAPNPAYAWAFVMDNGGQGYGPKTGNFYAWAVHTGDVGAVPVPAAVWLFGSGLLGLMGVGGKRRR